MNGEQSSGTATAVQGGGASQKNLLAGLGALVVLLLVGVGGYFLFFAKKETPAEVVKNMFAAMSKVTQVSSSIDLTLNANIPVSNPAALQQFLPLPQDVQPGSVVKVSMGFKVVGSSDTSQEGSEQAQANSKFSFSASGLSMNIDLDTRSKGDLVYIRINEVPLYLDMLGLSGLRGRWVKLDAGALFQQISAAAPQETNFEWKKIKKGWATVSEKANALLQKHPVLVVTAVLPDERLSDVAVHHYKFKFDQEHLRAFLKELMEESVRANALLLEQNPEVTEAGIASMKKDVFPSIDKFEVKGQGELWIGKADTHLYKFTFTPEAMSIEEEGVKVTMSGAVEFEAKDYGKPLTIEEPKDAIPLEQILGPLLQSMSSGMGL